MLSVRLGLPYHFAAPDTLKENLYGLTTDALRTSVLMAGMLFCATCCAIITMGVGS